MPILIAAVVAVGCLCLLDLLLTFGVIRRLREHTSMLTTAGGALEPYVGLRAGESPGPFSAVTISGEVAGAAGLRMVAFFSSWCSSCPEQVPPFVEYLIRHRIARDSVLAVIAGDNNAPPPYLDRLAEVTQACVVQDDSDIAKAFKVTGFPAFCLLDADGAVAASGYDPTTLPEPATV
jgi:thiol-disulfide isomerase/thioredoxin